MQLAGEEEAIVILRQKLVTNPLGGENRMTQSELEIEIQKHTFYN